MIPITAYFQKGQRPCNDCHAANIGNIFESANVYVIFFQKKHCTYRKKQYICNGIEK